MEDPESRALLEKARTRRTESSEAVLPWRVTQHEGWLDNDKATLAGKDHEEAMDQTAPDESAVDGEEKDPAVVLEAFRHNHPAVTADMDDKAKTIKVSTSVMQIQFYNANQSRSLFRHRPG